LSGLPRLLLSVLVIFAADGYCEDLLGGKLSPLLDA